MEKTKTRLIQEALENEGVSPKTARQAAVTIANDNPANGRTERGLNKILEAWIEQALHNDGQ